MGLPSQAFGWQRDEECERNKSYSPARASPQVSKMVLRYYNLVEQPFGVTPDPRFLFLGRTHREALASAFYAVIARRGFAALIAKPGMGKTTLLFDLLHKIRNQAKTVFLFQSQCSAQGLLRSLLEDLGIDDDSGDFMRMQRKLNECLLSQFSEGKRLVVVLDEAQNLDEPVLEVIRMLSNFETPREKLIHFVLAGQPQLAERLASPGLIQLRQRISIITHLKPFTAEETQQYIDHRLRVAGYDFTRPLFTKKAQAMIARYSEGIPRNINNICFNSMSLGCVAKQKTIDMDVIREVVGDLDLRPMFTKPAVVSKSEKGKESMPVLLSDDTSWLPRRSWSIGFVLALTLMATVGGLFVEGKGRVESIFASPKSLPAKDSAVTQVSYPVAQSQELGTASDAIAGTSQSSDVKLILVLPNETLYRISLKNFGQYDEETLAKVRELNPWLTNPDLIQSGQKILVPSTRSLSHTLLPVGEPADTTIDAGVKKP